MLIGGGGADSRPSDNAVGETNVEVGRILLPSWQLKLDVPAFSPFCAAIVPHPSPPHPPEGEHAALESGESGKIIKIEDVISGKSNSYQKIIDAELNI